MSKLTSTVIVNSLRAMPYSENKQSHGIMFHHFESEVHPWSQGALTGEMMASLLEFVGPKRILSAHEWYERSLDGSLEPEHLCLTFDDSLLCQYDVAWPVMADYGLTGFFYVYSSVFEGGIANLEIYRYFRSVAFESIDSFYSKFFDTVGDAHNDKFQNAIGKFNPREYLEDYPFFSDNDRLFRHVRDDVLTVPEYESFMNDLIAQKGFDKFEIRNKLWMTDEILQTLHKDGNIIGLHSYSHPMTMERCDVSIQEEEYTRNFQHLERVLGDKPLTMSHPCNSYNTSTINILENLGIKLGFRADMAAVSDRHQLEHPRQDHTNIVNMMA